MSGKFSTRHAIVCNRCRIVQITRLRHGHAGSIQRDIRPGTGISREAKHGKSSGNEERNFAAAFDTRLNGNHPCGTSTEIRICTANAAIVQNKIDSLNGNARCYRNNLALARLHRSRDSRSAHRLVPRQCNSGRAERFPGEIGPHYLSLPVPRMTKRPKGPLSHPGAPLPILGHQQPGPPKNRAKLQQQFRSD